MTFCWKNYNKGAFISIFLDTHTFEREKRNATPEYRSCSTKRGTQRCHAVLDKRENRIAKNIAIYHIMVFVKRVSLSKGKCLVYQKSFEI